MACQVALYINVSASAIEADGVPYDDQEYIQCCNGYPNFTRMCFFVIERGNHWRYVEDLLSLMHRLCRHGSHLVVNGNTGCCVSLDPLQIEDVIRTIAVRVERMVMQNSHREKIPFVASCDVILPRYGQPWEKEATMGSVDFSDFGVVPTTKAAIGLIEKTQRDEGFDSDNLEPEMGLEQFMNGCKRSRPC
ncbi:RING-type domain-containing protein [Psidium guajava]|nr:RING-type domain-containing protein [Psidium guajava]